MAVYNHTPLATGAALTAAILNAPLAQLDAAIRKNNYAATGAPTTGDDINDGYAVGSTWIDVTNDRTYMAQDVTVGAAVWKELSMPAAITQNFSIAGITTLTTAGSAPVYINDTSARSIFGHTGSINLAGINNRVQSHSATGTAAAVAGYSALQFSADTRGASLVLGKSRSATIALGGVVQSGDVLGEIIFNGDDATNAVMGAAIRAYSDGAPGTNDMPTRVEIQVSADGSASPAVALAIKATKSVILNAGAIATNATDGFLYIAACAGIPTGVPTAVTGRVPVVIDSTNNKMYIYSGGSWLALN